MNHPRSRGVYRNCGAPFVPKIGSSPLARGLRLSWGQRVAALGIIPARAGFTLSHAAASSGSRDYPRSRGVYHDVVFTVDGKTGSSPLARGLLQAVDKVAYLRRIIPARAGFTAPTAVPSSGPWDHPRSRGVYAAPSESSSNGLGSSPLARGLRLVWLSLTGVSRIIPARAGFTDVEELAW